MYLNIQNYALKGSKDLFEFSNIEKKIRKSLPTKKKMKPRFGNLKFTFKYLYWQIYIQQCKIICSKKPIA